MIATARSIRRLHLRNAAMRNRVQKRIPRPVPPHAIEREYVGTLARYADMFADIYKRVLLPRVPQLVLSADIAHDRLDAYTDTLDEILRQILLSLGAVTESPLLKNQARAIFDRINAHAGAQVDAQVNAIAGVPIASALPGGQEMADGFVSRNVSLIKSVAATEHAQVEQVMRDGLANGTRPEAIQDQLMERFGVAQSRAELIARDQVLKTFGQVTEARHKSLGLNRFIWRTSQDERVRGRPGGKYPKAAHDHWALEGKVFDYGSAPYGGPGRDFQCRCTAEPDLSDILGEDANENET